MHIVRYNDRVSVYLCARDTGTRDQLKTTLIRNLRLRDSSPPDPRREHKPGIEALHQESSPATATSVSSSAFRGFLAFTTQLLETRARRYRTLVIAVLVDAFADGRLEWNSPLAHAGPWAPCSPGPLRPILFDRCRIGKSMAHSDPRILDRRTSRHR